jgi:hypothetical protein
VVLWWLRLASAVAELPCKTTVVRTWREVNRVAAVHMLTTDAIVVGSIWGIALLDGGGQPPF